MKAFHMEAPVHGGEPLRDVLIGTVSSPVVDPPTVLAMHQLALLHRAAPVDTHEDKPEDPRIFANVRDPLKSTGEHFVWSKCWGECLPVRTALDTLLGCSREIALAAARSFGDLIVDADDAVTADVNTSINGDPGQRPHRDTYHVERHDGGGNAERLCLTVIIYLSAPEGAGALAVAAPDGNFVSLVPAMFDSLPPGIRFAVLGPGVCHRVGAGALCAGSFRLSLVSFWPYREVGRKVRCGAVDLDGGDEGDIFFTCRRGGCPCARDEPPHKKARRR